MTAVVDAVFCALGILTGYIGVLCRLNHVGRGEWTAEELKPTGKRLLYLIVVVASCGALVAILNVRYALALLSRLRLLALVLVLLPCAAVDIRQHQIPNRFLLAGLVARLALLALELVTRHEAAVAMMKNCLMAAGIMGGFFLLMAFLFKNSVGMGDIKLLMLIGLYLGMQGAFDAVFFSLLVLFMESVFFLLTKRKGRKDEIAFCPCVALGTFISISLTGM